MTTQLDAGSTILAAHVHFTPMADHNFAQNFRIGVVTEEYESQAQAQPIIRNQKASLKML